MDPTLRRALEHPRAHEWRTFYERANKLAKNIAALTNCSVRVASEIIAALSPMKRWDENVDLAWQASHLLRDDKSFDVDVVVARLAELPVMGSRRNAVADAWCGLGISGPKVTAFAKNIEGDRTVVTVDRHMLDWAGVRANKKGFADVTERVTNQAKFAGLYPAEVQALIWAMWREDKGLEDYK